MDINDVFSPDELEALSDDNRIAFGAFARKAAYTLHERTKAVASDDDEGWRFLVEERHSFVNLMIAAAKSFGIEAFATHELADPKTFTNDDYREFRSTLDHYVTQIALDNA